MEAARVTTLGALVDSWARRYRDRPALLSDHCDLTFAVLLHTADAWARALMSVGAGPGTHVGLLAANSPEWLAVAFGAWRGGVTLVPISTFVTTRELAEIAEHADIEVLILQPRLGHHDYVESLRSAAAPACLRQVVVLGDGPEPYESSTRFLERGRAVRKEMAEGDPESIAALLYTSGTTGRPKGVKLSHRAIMATVLPTAERGGLTSADILLSTLPLFWVAGLVIRALPTLHTGCALLLADIFTSSGIVSMMRRHRPTALHLRPPQVGQILAHPDFTPSLLANVRRGGGRAEWYAPHLDAQTAHLITGYGMTEMAGYVTALRWDDPEEVRGAQLGTPLPGVEIRIVDADGQICAPGRTGEIRLRGPGLFTGYQREPAGMGIDSDGFFCSGDVGRIDAKGTFEFSGRNKDLLRVKGINVSPLEVETILSVHPQVESAYVVGVPPDGLEQQLVALVVLRSPACPDTETELRALAAEALSHYKRPERYVFIDRNEVPLSGTSKPQRAALARLAAAHM